MNSEYFKQLIADFEKLKEAARESQKRAVLFADFSRESSGWFRTGEAFDLRPQQTLGADASHDNQMLRPGTWSSGRKGQRFFGVLRSPTFEITHPRIHYLMNAKDVQVRVIVDGFTMDVYNSLLFNGLSIKFSTGGQYAWKSQGADLKNHIGKRAHLEIIDHGQGFASIEKIYFSNEGPPKRSPSEVALQWLNKMEPTLEGFAETAISVFLEHLKNGPRVERFTFHSCQFQGP